MASRRSKALRLLGLLLAVLCLSVFSLEFILIPRALNRALGMDPWKVMAQDPELGLIPNPNVLTQRRVLDAGKETTLEIRTLDNGFSCVGKLDTPNRVLILGDSFTAGWEVNHDEIYSRVLSASSSCSIFAIGCGGYGTYHELKLLERHMRRIKPALVILQMCVNDPIDNCLELAEHSSYERAASNIGLIFSPQTPGKAFFTENDTVVFRGPGQGRVCECARDFPLRTVATGCVLLDNLVNPFPKSEVTVEKDDSVEQHRREAFAKSYRITVALLKNFKARCEAVPAFAFIAGDGHAPFRALLEKALVEAGVPELRTVPERLASSRKAGESVIGYDGFHWNANGHRICAEALKDELRKRVPAGN